MSRLGARLRSTFVSVSVVYVAHDVQDQVVWRFACCDSVETVIVSGPSDRSGRR